MIDAKKNNETEDSTSLKAGPLKSQLSLTIHTDVAIQLWNGRKRNNKSDSDNEKRWLTPSVPLFLTTAARVTDDALKGLLFAEMWLYRLEQHLNSRGEQIYSLMQKMEDTLKIIPKNVNISEIESTAPVNLDVYSRTPVGYRCVWLLIGVDQLALKVLQAYHYGLVSRQLRDKTLDDACHQVRSILGMAFRYRQVLINRHNIDIHNDIYQQAVKVFGELDADIISGKKRSAFLPLLKH
ncbi:MULTISPECIES: PFL_4669 family integrating conjugative element protein [Morganellaceae]|uniref:TIGR03761 family integrating conjugative element protein n=1 Tax=Morganella morganii TaxID=582 RepID=A0A8I0U4D2_MORMO|nr:TIGR03761 family integrating conjugative element protein [Morganella morganii]MBE8612925.1 TIGR03761 family integrating conjugative element protein [Morganella morganii]